MDNTILELLPNSKQRYRFDVNIYNIQDKIFERVTALLDTGCYNTMIPKRIAARFGRSLGFKRKYKIGGDSIEAEAYSIEKIMLKDFAIERVIAFAADYSGEFASDILIGTNVMNNWKMTFDRKANLFQFIENPPDDLPNKKHIYQNFFDTKGNYVLVQGIET